jgi:hypothetical protein
MFFMSAGATLLLLFGDGTAAAVRRAVMVEIAEAVLAVLNGASLSQSFVATRAYAPVQAQEALDTLEITVIPLEESMAQLSRRDDNFDYVVRIGIQRRIGKGAMTNDAINTACDSLLLLAEEIKDLFRSKTLEGYAAASSVDTSTLALFIPEHTDQHRVFTSIIALTFRKSRTR